MTNTADGSIMIDTAEGIAFFRLLAVEGVLKLDLLGMKGRVNGRQWVNREYGTDFKASRKGKEAALAFVRERILDAKVEKEMKALTASGLYEITDEDEARTSIRALLIEQAEEAAR